MGVRSPVVPSKKKQAERARGSFCRADGLNSRQYLGGTSRLCATGAPTVDPSVAPPKIVAEVECPLENLKSDSRRAVSGPVRRMRSADELDLSQRALQHSSPTNPCLRCRFSVGKLRCLLPDAASRHDGRSSPTDTAFVDARAHRQDDIVRGSSTLSSSFLRSQYLVAIGRARFSSLCSLRRPCGALFNVENFYGARRKPLSCL